jgi:ABC-2 type transport system permease protein
MNSAPHAPPLTTPSAERISAPAQHPGGVSLTVLWTLYVLTLRQYSHGKRWMVIAGLFFLPAGLAVLIRYLDPNVPSLVLEFLFAFMLIPQALLPLLALLYASGMIQDEQEEQTITYLLVRPLPRWALYVVKLLATLSTTMVLTVLFTAITYAAIYIGRADSVEAIIRRCAQAAGIHALAVATYCCLFGLLSLLTKRTLIVGILYSVIFEGLLANLPFGIRLLTIIYYTRLIAYRTLPFIEQTPRGPGNIAAEAWQFNVRTDPELLDHPTQSTCIIVLLSACAVSTVLSAIICSQREFHVKTPEGN